MTNKSKELNREIENRIEMEIVVDAYDESERAMGWYYYLQDNLAMPFKAECIQLVSTSPLKMGEIIEVVAMDSEESCGYDMFDSGTCIIDYKLDSFYIGAYDQYVFFAFQVLY